MDSVIVAPMPASMHLLHRLRIEDAEGRHVVESLAQDLGQHARGVHRAARGGVVVVVEQEHRPFGHGLGARHRLLQRLELVDEGLALRPGRGQQLVAQALGQRHVVVGGDDHAQPGVADVGMREADEQAGAQRTFGLHRLAARLQRAVGLVGRALAHHVRQHRHVAPGGGRLAPRPLIMRDQRSAGAPAGAVHVDVRIGLVAGDDVGMHRPSPGRGWHACRSRRRSASSGRWRGCATAACLRRPHGCA